jgi:hypothetical protein
MLGAQAGVGNVSFLAKFLLPKNRIGDLPESVFNVRARCEPNMAGTI